MKGNQRETNEILKLNLKQNETLELSQKQLDEIYEKLDAKLCAECERMGDKTPYIPRNGVYFDIKESNPFWWTNGFWAGMLWQMYYAGNNPRYREMAEKSELFMEEALQKFTGLHHDVGFQFLHTAVANYRLTGNEESKIRALHAATLLAGRFNPIGNYIRAWNLDRPGWMIIDCLMNIPLLYWAGQELDDPRFSYIADQHAHTALHALLREDGSVHHIAIFDASTGELLEHPAGQGFAVGSSWSRGQAWALYGFALAYFHTKKQEYLDTAKRIAHYFIANITLSGYVSLSDFRAPNSPVYWDTSATACAACGLLQIAEMVSEYEKPLYYEHAKKMLGALAEHHCNWNLEEDGILQNGTGTYGKQEDTHVSLIYGDYFFVEGILRLMGKSFFIW